MANALTSIFIRLRFSCVVLFEAVILVLFQNDINIKIQLVFIKVYSMNAFMPTVMLSN